MRSSAVCSWRAAIKIGDDGLGSDPNAPARRRRIWNTSSSPKPSDNLIQNALARHQGNVSLAAADLGLSRSALYRRLEKHGLG